MELSDADRELAMRLYEWAKADWKREIQQGFPFLRTFNYGKANALTYKIDTLSSTDQEAICKIFVNRTFVDILGRVGIKDIDRKATAQAIWEFETGLKKYSVPIPRADDVKDIRASWLLSHATRAVAGVLEQKPDRKTSRENYFFQKFGDWEITTRILASRKLGDPYLSCSHCIKRDDSQRGSVNLATVDLAGLLGVTEDAWDIVSRADAEIAIETLGAITRHLMSNIVPMFDGLGIAD